MKISIPSQRANRLVTNLEIRHQWKMIRRIGERRYSVLANLLTTRKLQNRLDFQVILCIKYIIDGVTDLPFVSDLPRGVGRLPIRGLSVWTVAVRICAGQTHGGGVQNGTVNRLDRLCVEIPAKHHRSVAAVLADEVQQILSLFVTKGGEERTLPGLQMGGGDAYLFSRFLNSQVHHQGHLVALHPPYFQNSAQWTEQLKFVGAIEYGTAVRSVVAMDVDAWGVGLGEEQSGVSLRSEYVLQEVEMVDFLQTNYVRTILDDFLNYVKSAVAPLQGLVRTFGEVVVHLSQSWNKKIKYFEVG